jgi:2-polyprenyl-6-hydroxyphenyl methylase/3-demethylubiquinone-9 3-methyltransferase
MQHAALARIRELTRQWERDEMTSAEMADPVAKDLDRSFKAAVRQAWSLGDYHRFALATVWQVGPVLVEACGIRRGQRVLDVAAGTGNVAIRAAEAGASVVASDLTPENFEAGRRAAAESGVAIEWVEADAEALPFDDGSFDAVTSSFGAMFAPDHAAVASELLRVCRPGGVIGMLTFRPVGAGADFFELVGRYTPPPPAGALPPLLWGTEDHVRDLFGGRVASLEMRHGQYVERAAGPDAYRDLFETTFGPVMAIRAGLAADPERRADFDRQFREFTIRANRGAPGGPAEYPFDYLLTVARRAPD